ncbi:LOW QUALITY PROTEIN: Cysteine protease [Phytophthora megakarya]|uniref:Cysteine protease n=1 Tax=Phytophthora megakarya TaxID=4795 RepID=A0A225VU49_9STRA|nr:LOW QUALITY PROTEIN: Cysteine protease [Phytophthora megakarya]
MELRGDDPHAPDINTGRRMQRRFSSGPGVPLRNSYTEVDGSITPHSGIEEDDSKDTEEVHSDGKGHESQRSADMSDGVSHGRHTVGSADGVAVEPPEEWHDSWLACQTYLADYCARTMQILPVKETMSRSEHNRRLQRTKKRSSEIVPDGCDPYQRTYICTHGWLKQKSRSDGSRPRHRLQLQVNNGSYLRNHLVSKFVYKTYPASCGVKKPLIKARVEGMLVVGAQWSCIYDYLHSHDQNDIQSDCESTHPPSQPWTTTRPRSKPEFVKIAVDKASQVDSAIHKMWQISPFERVVTENWSDCFSEYFESTRHTCQDLVVFYFRSILLYFKLPTNNRLEDFFGKLKDSVDRSMSMSPCVKAILAYDRRKQNEYEYRLARIEQFRGYDEEMKRVFRFTTDFVPEQIEQQYSVALEKVSLYKYVSEPGQPDLFTRNRVLVTVCGETVVHKLKLDDWSCDCEFAMAMMLSCPHVIAYRKYANLPGSISPMSRIDKRWTSTARTLKKVTQFGFSPSEDPDQMQRILTPAQRS